ncbi:head-tail joining protein [Paenirhodobacter enshiensis]|uniref:head-tail joining protein n=1 Tax=Paenirhodobacter enshiensis TaxID=1105367 RepID=UPI003FA22D7E
MASLFDGMGGTLSDLFGAPVRYIPSGGASAGVGRDVQSLFRRAPFDAIDDDGRPVVTFLPSWQVRRDLVPELARGDRIEPGDGESYTVVTIRPETSPDAEAFMLCALDKVLT